jgi:hypothetical protein
MGLPGVHTHINVDLDAVAGVWAAGQFMGAQDTELVFVPANWDGDGIEDGDLALDIRAGGRGIKSTEHEDGTVGPCFAWIIANHAYVAVASARTSSTSCGSAPAMPSCPRSRVSSACSASARPR